MYCYLFKQNIGEQYGRGAFVIKGFSNWKKMERLRAHVGGKSSIHSQARKKCKDLMNQDQHIEPLLSNQAKQTRKDYKVRLATLVDCVRFLLRQGLVFRGHDESNDSSNRGNFQELLQFLADHNDEIKHVTLKNAPENLKLTISNIQKDILNVVPVETINVIIKDLGNALYSILVDESRDISTKEQMAVVLCYVNKNGLVIEHFLGIEHVGSTTAISLRLQLIKYFQDMA